MLNKTATKKSGKKAIDSVDSAIAVVYNDAFAKYSELVAIE